MQTFTQINTHTLANPNIEPDDSGLRAIMKEVASDAMRRRKSSDAQLMSLIGAGDPKSPSIGTRKLK